MNISKFPGQLHPFPLKVSKHSNAKKICSRASLDDNIQLPSPQQSPRSLKYFRKRRVRERGLEPPIPPNQPRPVENLAYYATPPTSPAAYRTITFDSPLGGFNTSQSGGMEGDERQRRQFEQPSFIVAPGGSIADALDPRAGPGGNGTERLGQSQMLAARNQAAVSITPNGNTPQDLGSYGYPQGQQYAAPQMHGNQLQYAPDYTQVTQRHQQYPNYTSQVMYNVSPQTQQSSPFDPVQHLQSRQPAALEVLPTQLSDPHYYNAVEATSAPVAASITQQYTPAQFQQPLQYQTQAPLPQSALPSTYTSGLADFAQSSTPEMIEPQDENTSIMELAHGQYLRALKEAFENTHAGRLVEAGRALLEISVWLIGHAGDLGGFSASAN